MSRKILTIGSLVIIGLGVCATNSNYLMELVGLNTTIKSPAPTIIKPVGTIQVAFSPNNGITAIIVKSINDAIFCLYSNFWNKKF